MNNSMFKLYSIGIAAENKVLGESTIEVHLIEQTGFIDGELTSNPTEIVETGTTRNGETYNESIVMTNSISAMWLPFGSNRKTPPDVRRGEHIAVWKYADADVYYWSALGLDEILRRLETVIYAFSNTKDEATKELTPDNTYWFEVSTHQGTITLGTSKSNGEKFKYTIQINAKDGGITITDDNELSITLDSNENKVEITNADGTKIGMIGSKVYSSGKTLDLDFEQITMKCKNYRLTCGDGVVVGATRYTSTLTAAGGFSMPGGVTATFAGNSNFTASIKHNGVDIGSNHRHNHGEPITGNVV